MKIKKSEPQRKNNLELVSQREYAKHRMVSSTWISKLVRAGKIPSVAGKINPAEADRILAEDAQSDGGSVTFAEAERRWRLDTARLKELELGEREGELVDVAYVIAAEAVTNRSIRDALLSIPTRVAGLVSGKDRRVVIAEVTRLIHSCLSNLQEIAALKRVGDVLCPECARLFTEEDEPEQSAAPLTTYSKVIHK